MSPSGFRRNRGTATVEHSQFKQMDQVYSQSVDPNMKPIDILLVEDDAGEAFLIGEILAEFPLPLKLRIARDGMEALLMLASGVFQPGLIIVDLNLPYISGHGVIERFHPNDVPIVVFSSSPNEADKQRALKLGAREYIQKPMHLHAYKDAVRGIVEKWAV
jgi:DNA-binding response OmpR family regulator